WTVHCPASVLHLCCRFFIFFFYCSADHRDLHSFPTRRSSDLGKLLLDGRVELYPFRVPMSWKARFALLCAGAKVRAGVLKYGRVAKRKPLVNYSVQQRRGFNFMNEKTFS